MGRQSGVCDPRDGLAYRVWSMLGESQRAYAAKFAESALSSSQAANPLDSLSWTDVRKVELITSPLRTLSSRQGAGSSTGGRLRGREPCRRCQELGVEEALLKHPN